MQPIKPSMSPSMPPPNPPNPSKPPSSGAQPERDMPHSLLRQWIGFIAAALPIVLGLGGLLLLHIAVQPSVSDYYHTGLRDILVGALCAIGVFLCFYQGYDDGAHDRAAAKLAGVCAIGVAWFPTPPPGQSCSLQSLGDCVHGSLAAVLFLTLAYFCLLLFPRTAPGRRPSHRKLLRNRLYKTCGVIILVCIALILGVFVFTQQDDLWMQKLAPVFWLEALALGAFALSWLTKGEMLMADE